ncbi:hypothetical protein HRI_002173400 [Hibiscus trionum]|uniref:Uncharacterized protein n=1 Tax=Hibiscus trionum TaxID=183268 RepID=A0A9W7M2C7_HIBTR|nr:hypothetical protein HRI_002173400 [Hibiscus trionum]
MVIYPIFLYLRIDDLANQGSKSFKQKREEERKASEASGDTRAWNSLFMHPDTVVENIARKYGVSKSELLDREADDLAVRIAFGGNSSDIRDQKSPCKCWSKSIFFGGDRCW